jgi:hypothetical protein
MLNAGNHLAVQRLFVDALFGSDSNTARSLKQKPLSIFNCNCRDRFQDYCSFIPRVNEWKSNASS